MNFTSLNDMQAMSDFLSIKRTIASDVPCFLTGMQNLIPVTAAFLPR